MWNKKGFCMFSMQKVAYIVGITIAISVFTLFLYSFLPHIIQNDQWERIDGLTMSDEDLLKEFYATPAYVAFYERFPDAKEELNNHRHGGELQVGIANLEKGNFLKLHLYYNDRDERMNVNVSCETPNNRENMHSDGLFAIDFIKQTDCLNLETDSDLVEKHTTTVLPNGLVRID